MDLWEEWPLQGFEQRRGLVWTRCCGTTGCWLEVQAWELSVETVVPIPVNRDGSLDQGGSPRGGDVWSDSVCALKEERKQFVIPGGGGVGRKERHQ